MVEGVHFDNRLSAADVGYKAVTAAVSDLGACGAEPAWLLLSLSLPDAPGRDRWVEGLADGVGEACLRHGVYLVGGDTTGVRPGGPPDGLRFGRRALRRRAAHPRRRPSRQRRCGSRARSASPAPAGDARGIRRRPHSRPCAGPRPPIRLALDLARAGLATAGDRSVGRAAGAICRACAGPPGWARRWSTRPRSPSTCRSPGGAIGSGCRSAAARTTSCCSRPAPTTPRRNARPSPRPPASRVTGSGASPRVGRSSLRGVPWPRPRSRTSGRGHSTITPATVGASSPGCSAPRSSSRGPRPGTSRSRRPIASGSRAGDGGPSAGSVAPQPPRRAHHDHPAREPDRERHARRGHRADPRAYAPTMPWLNVVVVTPVLVLFSEITPKIIAYRFRANWTQIVAWPFTVWFWAAMPRAPRVLQDRLRGRPARRREWADDDVPPEEELMVYIDHGAATGALDPVERDIIEAVFEFDELTVERLMTPRPDAFSIPLHTPHAEDRRATRERGVLPHPDHRRRGRQRRRRAAPQGPPQVQEGAHRGPEAAPRDAAAAGVRPGVEVGGLDAAASSSSGGSTWRSSSTSTARSSAS